MTSILILLALATIASVTMMVRTVLQDGYGHRPPPRSHRADAFQRHEPLERV